MAMLAMVDHLNPSRIPIRQPRKRTSKPKVRTGCLSCKARHIKCDERHPACYNCEKAGNECRGYRSSAKGQIVAPRKLLPRNELTQNAGGLHIRVSRTRPIVHIAAEDVGYLDLFRYSLVDDLSGRGLDSNFWSRTVLCETMTDPCVRHSVLALGALAQALLLKANRAQRGNVPISSVHRQFNCILSENHRAALCHHTKAISMLQHRINKPSRTGSRRDVLIITMLLVAYETLQGNLKAADGLLKGAKVLLARYFMDKRPVEEASDTDDVASLLLQTSIISGCNPFFQGQRMEVWPFFCDFDELMERALEDRLERPSITTIRAASIPDIRALLVRQRKFSSKIMVWVHRQQTARLLQQPIMPEDYEKQKDHIIELRHRHRCMQAISEKPGLDAATRRSVLLVVVYVKVAYIWAATALDLTGMLCDDYGQDFADIVRLCAELLRDGRRMSSMVDTTSMTWTSKASFVEPAPCTGFTADTFGIVPALLFVGTLCRVRPDVREQAVDLMNNKVEWREGTWDTKVVARGLKELIKLEDTGAVWLDTSAPPSEGDIPTNPPVSIPSLNQDCDSASSTTPPQSEVGWTQGSTGPKRVIPASSRWLWTNAVWDEVDLSARKLTNTYTRYYPDEKTGGSVNVDVVIDFGVSAAELMQMDMDNKQHWMC